MTDSDFIIELFSRVDDEMKDVKKHSQAQMYPSEIISLGIVFALKGTGTRLFYRWISRNFRDLFPKLLERSRFFRALKQQRKYLKRFMAKPSLIYAGQFLVMAALSDYLPGFVGAMIAGATVTCLPTYLLFRSHPSALLRYLVYGLIAFFSIIYPLSGLLPDQPSSSSFDAIVQFFLIMYLFGIALYYCSQRRKETAA